MDRLQILLKQLLPSRPVQWARRLTNHGGDRSPDDNDGRSAPPSFSSSVLFAAGPSVYAPGHQGDSLTSQVADHGFPASCESFSISADVWAALNNLHDGPPVVALESTIITHGLPYPTNLECARQVEQQVRDAGGVPATIAILQGRVHIGLSADQLEQLAQMPSAEVVKCSRRDLAVVIAQRRTASTTVAATMWLAHQCGIHVFVTGGLGGVHRGFEETMDVSADLYELQQTPVAVVCAGVKSILDVPRTVELLETLGVPTLGIGTQLFPGFYSPQSEGGARCSATVERTDEGLRQAGQIVFEHCVRHRIGGCVVAVPIEERTAQDAQEIQRAIDQALREAKEQQVAGRDVTPFILARVHELSHGASLKANVELICQNAQVGTQIAVHAKRAMWRTYRQSALQAVRAGAPSNWSTPLSAAWLLARLSSALGLSSSSSGTSISGRPSILCCGAALMDVLAQTPPGQPVVAACSNPGRTKLRAGGVANNVCRAVDRLTGHAVEVDLLTALPMDDPLAQILAAGIPSHRFILWSRSGTASSPTYAALLDGKTRDLVAAVADTSILDEELRPDRLDYEAMLRGRRFVVMDGNLRPDTMKRIAEECHIRNVPVFFEPTSDVKAHVPAEHGFLHRLTMAKPSLSELPHLCGRKEQTEQLTFHDSPTFWSRIAADYGTVLIHRNGMRAVIVTLGPNGAALMLPMAFYRRSSSSAIGKVVFEEDESATDGQKRGLVIIYYRTLPLPATKIVNTNGAGDCFAAGVLSSLALQHPEDGMYDWDTAVSCGLRAAQLALQDDEAVPASLAQLQWMFQH